MFLETYKRKFENTSNYKIYLCMFIILSRKVHLSKKFYINTKQNLFIIKRYLLLPKCKCNIVVSGTIRNTKNKLAHLLCSSIFLGSI